MTKGFGFARSLSYIYGIMSQLKEIQLTQHEWNDAMRVPAPYRDKKKYYRKEKHKNSWKREG